MDIVEVPTVVLLCLFQGLVAGLLRPRPSLKQFEQSSSSGKFHERHTRTVDGSLGTETGNESRETGERGRETRIDLAEIRLIR